MMSSAASTSSTPSAGPAIETSAAKTPTVWYLYLFQNTGLDPEQEFMMETADLNEAVERVRKDFQAAHETCPDECVSLESVPTGVEYDEKYRDDAKGAFFKLPADPEAHDVINIAAIYSSCAIEYYVAKKSYMQAMYGETDEDGEDGKT